jgi:alkylhydroperoxidase/carboxymuconolactone decarboxylase family protein YurZ
MTFTVSVFQDAAWAAKGIAALKDARFTADMFSILAKDSPDAAALIEKTLGAKGDRLEVANLGSVVARGALVDALQGSARDLGKVGIAATMRRVGFQPHDARIYETLTGRGGVLVAIQTEPRAADALAILFSYGGGNAAIGAWTGRV